VFPWLYHIPSLADVTMETKACIFIAEQKVPICIAGLKYKRSMDGK
jgi:hypothetical protein